MDKQVGKRGFPLPYLLSFDGKGGFRPGRGEAGWTMGDFADRDDAIGFMATYPEAAMPCWKRIESGEL